ncbi:MAG: hypothetical protein K8R25_07285 [Methanosarcinales archaeon]|nr:hypothetical protein [Methanosarcinales archaeon]
MQTLFHWFPLLLVYKHHHIHQDLLDLDSVNCFDRDSTGFFIIYITAMAQVVLAIRYAMAAPSIPIDLISSIARTSVITANAKISAAGRFC